MPVNGRRDEYAEITRTAIVDAAVRCFTEDGFAGASMDTIAATARVSKGAVYHHFTDKTKLFEAAFISMEERLQTDVAVGVEGITDPWELVHRGVSLFLQACCDTQFRRIVLEEAPTALGWQRWKEIEERYFLGMVTAAVVGLARAGLIQVPDEQLVARMFLSALGVAGMAVPTAAEQDAERNAMAQLVMRFLGGLA